MAGNSAVIPQILLPLVPWMPYVFAAVGGPLAWKFNRSRSVFLLVLLISIYWLVTVFLPSSNAAFVDAQLGYAAASFLLPINIFVLSFLEDRGVLTGWGILLFSIMLIQAVAVAGLMYGGDIFFGIFPTWRVQESVLHILYARILPESFDAWTYLPQSSLLCTAFAVLLLFPRASKGDPMQIGFFGALVCAMAGLHYVTEPDASALMISTAALLLTFTLFQESYSMAYLDELTELPSRRALVADFKKLGRKYAVAMADIDHFKKFNDTYGHDVGDEVLRMVAGKLAQVSGGGTAYRYGGEEFTIVFPRCSKSEVTSHLDAIRKSIEETPFLIRGPLPKKSKGKKDVSVTVSIGVAERGEDATTPEQVIKQADKALYQAKKRGRNRVEVG